MSSIKAWLLGMPTKWSRYMFVALLALLPVIPVSPLIGRLMRCGRSQPVYPELSLCRKCVCVLLAYSILMGPGVSEAIAVDSTLYTNLCAGTWGADNTTIIYAYDENGSVVEKRTITTGSSPEDVISRTGYVYDLAGQLYEVRELSADGSTVISWTRYSYNDDGIRIRSEDSSGLIRTFLIDPANGTGYAQVLEEYDGTTRTSYTIGDDVLAQKAGSAQPQYLLYDGHGSTRQLADSTGAVTESYTYDAYGMPISFNPASAATNLLYSGEKYDSSLSQYYLRARYYDPSNGRFTQTDPFEGNSDDPQSLHKYTYCHNDPVSGIDPSGMLNLVDITITIGIIGAVIGLLLPAESLGERARNALALGLFAAFAADVAIAATCTAIFAMAYYAGWFVVSGEALITVAMVAVGGSSLAAGTGDSWYVQKLQAAYNSLGWGHKAPPSQPVNVMLSRQVSQNREYEARLERAYAKGQPRVCTLSRSDAEARRQAALSSIPKKEGFDRDEWPMAFTAQGGRGSDVEYVTPSVNRSAGAQIGGAMRPYQDGTEFRVIFYDGPPPPEPVD